MAQQHVPIQESVHPTLRALVSVAVTAGIQRQISCVQVRITRCLNYFKSEQIVFETEEMCHAKVVRRETGKNQLYIYKPQNAANKCISQNLTSLTYFSVQSL